MDPGSELHDIQTRQKSDELFRSEALLAAAATTSLDARRVEGYGVVRFIIFSDVTFRLRVEESPADDQPFVETRRFASVLNSAGTAQLLCIGVPPCGALMRVFIDNTSGATMTSFELAGAGLPVGEASGGGGGGGNGAQGDRFRWTSAGNNVAATTSFVATAPQAILVGGSTKDTIVEKIRIYLAVPGGESPVNVRLIIDTADRYTSGGTARTPAQMNTGSTEAADGDHYVDGAILATAAGAGTREAGDAILENVVGKFVDFDLEGDLMLSTKTSLLLYWHGGGTAVECRYDIVFKEAAN